MDPKVGGGLAGCGCGVIVGFVACLISSGVLTFASYLAYEAHYSRMQADTSVPLAVAVSALTSPCCALAAAIVAGVLVHRLLSPKE